MERKPGGGAIATVLEPGERLGTAVVLHSSTQVVVRPVCEPFGGGVCLYDECMSINELWL